MQAFTVRFEDDVYKELSFLADLYGVSRNALVNQLVRTEFSKYQEDPKIKKMLDNVAEFKGMLEQFQKKLSTQ